MPVTALFRKHEEQRDASYVEAGKGLVIQRRGTRVGHRYELLGHTISGRVAIEPYLVTLTEESEVFPLFQHAGIEFIHLLEGEVVYRAAGSTYRLSPGDSLLFDGDVAHGPGGARAAPRPHARDHLARGRGTVSRGAPLGDRARDQPPRRCSIRTGRTLRPGRSSTASLGAAPGLLAGVGSGGRRSCGRSLASTAEVLEPSTRRP